MRYFSLICFLVLLFARDSPAQHQMRLPEYPDDPYVPTNTDARERTPAYRFSGPGFFYTQVNVDSNGMNIVGDAANEPSIAVDRNNSSRMAIGWRQFDTITNNFRQAGNGYTTDGGLTWIHHDVIEPGIFRSDPVLASDGSGNFYYNSLTVQGGDFACDVFKSTDGGATWDAGTFAWGGDKQWMTIDQTGGIGDGNIYAFWTLFFSVCAPEFFTRSPDRGATYDACTVIPGSPYWGTLATGADGELYVCGTDGFRDFLVAKSVNARDPAATIAWDQSVTIDLGGEIGGNSASPNPAGLLGQAWVDVDRSGGPSSGNVYLLCSVTPFTTLDPQEVMFTRSTDGGLTWGDSVRVNDDEGNNWQWFGTMSVAPNGRIDAVWLDTRDNPGTYLSSLYYAASHDGGESWSSNIRLSDAFDPHLGWPQQNKIGDYYHMVSHDDGAHLAWAATFNGEQDVYYGYIPASITDVGEWEDGIPTALVLEQNYPNPFNPSTSIGFGIRDAGYVMLVVYDVLGRQVATLVDEPLAPGAYTRQWDAGDLPSGVYYYRLTAAGNTATRKLMLLK